MSASGSSNCAFCCHSSKYTCPQCNTPYCSVACYRNEKHSICSEAFYKNLVQEALKDGHVSEESRRKMTEILHRFQDDELESNIKDNESLDSDDDEDLATRMEGVDLDDSEVVWENLTESEKVDFKDLVMSEDIDIIPPWIPWWEQNISKIEVINEESEKPSLPYGINCPPLIQVPEFSSITGLQPSPCIPFNILNVLVAYAWVMRLFNGDHMESCLDATEALFSLSSVLSVGANFEDPDIALSSPKVESHNALWLCESDDLWARVKLDAMALLQGPCISDPLYYVLAALSDIYALLDSSKTLLSHKKRNPTRRAGLFASTFGTDDHRVELKKTNTQLVKKSLKKLEYLVSYIKKFGLALNT